MKQFEAVIEVLRQHQGVATLAELYRDVPKVPDCAWATKTPQASIRRIVQLCNDIFKIKPGLYGLVSMRKDLESRGIIAETATNKSSLEIVQSNHTYYQGLLLIVGKCRHFDCWAPNQDKNKQFLNQRLDALRTIQSLPAFSYPHLIRRSQTVDVLWFNERKMPSSMFEIEFSTDIQNSLLKFNDLQDFHAKIIIVADATRRNEYVAKLAYSAFRDISQRVKFLDFSSLVKQYELVMAQENAEVLL